MKSFISFLILVLLIINAGCDSTTEPIKEKLLKGIVKDTQGNLLSDAKIFISYEFEPGLVKEKPENRIYKPLGLNDVELTSFTAYVFSNGVRLGWSTATELNNLGFEIHKKILIMFTHLLVLLTETVQPMNQKLIHLLN